MVRSAFHVKATHGLRGFGCKGPLANCCPYPIATRSLQCPWTRHLRKDRPDREPLLDAAACACEHVAPASWTREREMSARFALVNLAAEEKRRGLRPYSPLFISQRELSRLMGAGWGRKRVMTLLRHMREAGWCEVTDHGNEWGGRGRLATEVRRLEPGRVARAGRGRAPWVGSPHARERTTDRTAGCR